MLFKAECLKRNLVVLSPEHVHLPFDVAVFTRGKFLTIQVKGTGQLHVSGHYARFQCLGSSSRKSYRDQGVDFFAAYVGPRKSWYLIPTIHLTGKTFEIRLGADAKANDWLERWDFLGAPFEVG